MRGLKDEETSLAKSKTRLQIAGDHDLIRSAMKSHEMSKNHPEKNRNWKTQPRSEDMCLRLGCVFNDVYKLGQPVSVGICFPFCKVRC